MGAGASVPDKVDLDTCKSLAGDRFDQSKFDEYKDADGYITRDQLLAAENLILQLEPHGDMGAEEVMELKETVAKQGERRKSRVAEEDMLSLSVSKTAAADTSTLDGQEEAEPDVVAMKETMERQSGRRQSHSKTVEDDMLDLVNKSVPLEDVEAAVDEIEEAKELEEAKEEAKAEEGKE
mmetsp:Transcript_44438/g.121113  ORF Transcript_44438/g.121113 Transcript_44438/m.121113 type:complete len:180 (+) Transcript_44438:372-911(+)|eukprot:CAMPEP_0119479256 /NCGR_PEP_ID=MMETSP1344-20130328/8609_1 /TAXON_ID=236787 /ORGANISM="Florenciella parvula, Strain CCMP2471" /LENGTH=179 /DNA_ID=CAMNT_0007513477 /DNA_START=516 /DNA_END=1055 /DNA_ORIENTATION=-